MEDSLRGRKVATFEPPEGVIGVYVDPHSGELATTACPTKRLSYYVVGTEPTDYCKDHPTEKKKKKKEKDSWFKRLFDWF